MEYLYAMISVLVVSLISVVFAVPFIIRKKVRNSTLLILLSISVGVMLGTVFYKFLPELALEGFDIGISSIIMLGFLSMFILEKLVHYHHNKACENGDCGHSHAYHLAPINLVGDGIHNFIDGLVIAGAFAIDVHAGLVTTISIIFHEIPQEIADFGVLLYSGLSKWKALLYNLLSGLTAVLGTIAGIIIAGSMHNFSMYSIAFASGNFLYIAGSNLLPQLHRHCKLKETIYHIFAIIIGIGIIIVISAAGLVHSH